MNKQKKVYAAFAVCFLLCGSSSFAQKKYELTVKDAVELAFKNVTDVKNALVDYKLQEALNKEITGQALPQVSGTGSVSYYIKLPLILFPDASESGIYDVLKKEGVRDGNGNPITKNPAPVLRQISFQQPWNANFGATLSQLLFQPDVFVGLQARKTSLSYYKANEELVKERVKDSAYRRYYAILIAQKQLEFIKSGVERLKKLYNDNSIMYKNGFAEKLDIDKVQVQLTNLQTTESVLENSINQAYAALKFSIGISQKDTVVLKETLTSEEIKKEILSDEFKYEDRKEIQALDYSRELQKLDVKRFKLGYIPTLSSFLSYGLQGLGSQFITSSNTTWLRNSMVGVNLNVPIFDGFQRKSKIQQANLRLEKLDNTIDNMKQVIDFQQTVTSENLKNALLNLDAQQRNMVLAESVYQTTKKKFEQGLGSSFEVLQSDNDWQTAQSNYFGALYNAIIAKISYQSSLGKLN